MGIDKEVQSPRADKLYVSLQRPNDDTGAVDRAFFHALKTEMFVERHIGIGDRIGIGAHPLPVRRLKEGADQL